MRRESIVGCGGAGKSRLVPQLSEGLGLPLIGPDAYWRLVNDRAGVAFLRAPVACSGEPGTGSPTRKCTNEEATAISEQVSRPSRSDSAGNGCGTA